MIRTVLRISWLNLRRDRPALVLTFVMPVILFSIFAAVFGSMDEGRLDPVATLLIHDEADPVSSALAAALHRQEALRIVPGVGNGTSAEATKLIRNRVVRAAVVIPALRALEEPAPIRILADTSNPMTVGVVRGSLRAASFELVRFAPGVAEALSTPSDPLEVAVESVLGGDEKRPSVAFFAAGIGVMFLLFATTGRSAMLIEEREDGVLTRLLTSGLGMGRLLLGRWLFLTLLGTAQVTVMFIWGSLAFGLDLWTLRNLTGFGIVTLAAAAAAAALALLLSTVCRTRARLNGVSTALILVMSALGGSMFPRFLMPEELRRVGLATFNAWALDGYQKVFWYETPLWELWPQLLVLTIGAVVLGLLARGFARRWETEVA